MAPSHENQNTEMAQATIKAFFVTYLANVLLKYHFNGVSHILQHKKTLYEVVWQCQKPRGSNNIWMFPKIVVPPNHPFQ